MAVREVPAEWVAARLSSSDLAIVDVRGPEREGGWIPGSWDVPHVVDVTSLAKRVAESGATRVVFHCMFSQCRGPGNAARFAAELAKNRISRVRVYVLAGGMAGWVNRYYGTELVEGFDSSKWKKNEEGLWRHTSEGPFNREIKTSGAGRAPGTVPQQVDGSAGDNNNRGRRAPASWASLVAGTGSRA